MTSPVYSALPHELLLELDPRRPGINKQIKMLGFSEISRLSVAYQRKKTVFYRENRNTAARIQNEKQSKMPSCHSLKQYKCI